MSNLSITIFNRFQILLDGNPITDQLRLKTQGLVAYLAVEVEKPHRREELAGLLWPDQPEDSARSNLRQSLVQLRHVLGGTFSDYFDISPLALMYTPIQGNDVDVTQFSALIQSCNQHHHTRPETCPECFERLNTAMELYQGELLKNFSIKNSTVFDEWIMINREKYHRQAMSALYNLAEYYAFHSNFTLMSQVAQRQIDLDPLQENAYRQLMRSLVLSGKRNEALLVYEDLRILLDREMHIQPELGTITLYQQIYSGKFKTSKLFHSPHSGPTTSPKPFLNDREPERNEIPLLVAREQELARMENLFNQAMSGRGQLVLISGDAGRGKTALLSEFSRLTLLREASVVIAGGNGNAQTGVGDPYLPFREILAQLSGDVEDRWTAGSINKEQASRLWNLIPATIQIVMDKGPDLINTFLNGKTLLKRALSFISITDVNEVTWPLQLEQLVEQKMQNSLSMTGAVAFQQIGLFDQFTQVLHTLALQNPLILILDDLQWADLGTSSLFFHLANHLAGSRILLLGAYRPEDINHDSSTFDNHFLSGGDHQKQKKALRLGVRYPLGPTLDELKHSWGKIEISLDQEEDRRFIDAYIDSRRNRLGKQFREKLFHVTRGHPLFTIEILRGMVERGDIRIDHQGYWEEGSLLDWDTLPVKVEAVISERMQRLPNHIKKMMDVACVEGEVFTAEVVARVLNMPEIEVLRTFGDDLDTKHQLLRALGISRMGSRRLSHYRFRHILYQKYLYQNLDQVERPILHEAIANALEEIYLNVIDEVDVQLAWHFQEAGIQIKAIEYYRQSGERAARLSANQEAIAHFNQALVLLKELPATLEQDHQELYCQLGLAKSLQIINGIGDLQAGVAYTRAWELCNQLGETTQLFPTLWLYASVYATRGNLFLGLEIMERVMKLAEVSENPQLIAIAHWGIGWDHFFMGRFLESHAHLEKMIDLYDPGQHHSLAEIYSQDPGVTCISVDAVVLWILGYPTQAKKRAEDANTLAQNLLDPYSLALALTYRALLGTFQGDFEDVKRTSEECIQICQKHQFGFWLATSTFCMGWALAEEGQLAEGIGLIDQSIHDYRKGGEEIGVSHMLAAQAKVYGDLGRIEEGLGILSAAIDRVKRTGEGYYEAELHRLTGDLLLREEPVNSVESGQHFLRAIEIARAQKARFWELRATVSLCKLAVGQGKSKEVLPLLEAIYNQFDDGFDGKDLLDAKKLIQDLGSG